MAAKNQCTAKFIVKRYLSTLKNNKLEWIKDLISAVEDNFDQITADVKFFNVWKVQGVVFRIRFDKKKRLCEYRINESLLPTTLAMEVTSLTDYSADETLDPLE